MSYVIASDIHGSAYFCRQLLAAYVQEQAQGLILLGDILYHGPRNDLPQGYAPKEVIAMLNAWKEQILCVRGNCDAEVDQMVLDFDLMTPHRLVELCRHKVLLTHGHHCNISAPPAPSLVQDAQAVLYGHTHVPLGQWKDGLWYLNPGSVSIPKEGSHHGYMLLEEETVFWKDLSGRLIRQEPWPERK